MVAKKKKAKSKKKVVARKKKMPVGVKVLEKVLSPLFRILTDSGSAIELCADLVKFVNLLNPGFKRSPWRVTQEEVEELAKKILSDFGYEVERCSLAMDHDDCIYDFYLKAHWKNKELHL